MPVPLHDPTRHGFASDNTSGAHPEVIEAIVAANLGHLTSYGDDPYTARLQEVIRTHFGPQATAYPVFNGTGANVMSLGLLTERWDAVICTETAHIHVDECGAPEKLVGVKTLTVDSPDGKLTPALIDRRAHGFGFEHHAQPKVVSVTQSTELGTVYSPEELRALADHAHRLGMLLHVDGSRLANAAVSLDCGLGDITTAIGADILSLGGTKNGLLGAEAVVVLNPDAVRGPLYVRKLLTQLPSKMRFISAQLIALYEGDLWQRSAGRANAMAARLAAGVRDLPGVRITQAVESDAVFAILPKEAAARLREQFFFYDWDEATGEVRWMCSFDTTEADVDAFLAALRESLD
ncbi:threonine aldolase family protein [Raineyella fluvialis]|uniref:Threonine aldolase n=1 Tax=Raineyella fluvialis TaxID=2662261 RepID=A0A5Q2FF45_9ACTN|nr:low specificity L-threonine aldolase [Raineyella fluvialis]QGF23723.1 threonine aldolase [Raineyella fluvialis]